MPLPRVRCCSSTLRRSGRGRKRRANAHGRAGRTMDGEAWTAVHGRAPRSSPVREGDLPARAGAVRARGAISGGVTMSLGFRRSERMTLGVELELQLLDRESRNLFPAAPRLFQRL